MKPVFTRFSVCLGEEKDGKFIQSKVVGNAFRPDGNPTYTLCLYTFVNEKFYVMPDREDSTKYLVMSREQSPVKPGKYFWHVVGHGDVLSKFSVVRLTFDLFAKPFYLSLFPQKQASSFKNSEKENV